MELSAVQTTLVTWHRRAFPSSVSGKVSASPFKIAFSIKVAISSLKAVHGRIVGRESSTQMHRRSTPHFSSRSVVTVEEQFFATHLVLRRCAHCDSCSMDIAECRFRCFGLLLHLREAQNMLSRNYNDHLASHIASCYPRPMFHTAGSVTVVILGRNGHVDMMPKLIIVIWIWRIVRRVATFSFANESHDHRQKMMLGGHVCSNVRVQSLKGCSASNCIVSDLPKQLWESVVSVAVNVQGLSLCRFHYVSISGRDAKQATIPQFIRHAAL